MKNVFLARRLGWIALALSLVASPASSQDTYCVRAGASGANTGADWNNAYPTLPVTLQRGATYYIADGTYSGYTFDDPASGTNAINIKKATIADHGPSTGWLSSYGDGQAVFNAGIRFATGYWLFDGQTGGGPTAWTNGFGFKIEASSGAGANINGPKVIFRHVEIQGNGGDGDGAGSANDGVSIGADSITISYCYIYDMGRTIFFCNRGNNDVTVEYTCTGYHENTAGQHSEIASLWGTTVKVSNWTFRYCLFTHSEGTGGLIYEGSGLQVYGCVFAPLYGNTLGGGNGLIGTWTASAFTAAKIYNNTFINCGAYAIGILNSDDNGDFQNNLLYNSRVGTGNGFLQLSHGNNHYISVSDLPAEATRSTASSMPFVSYLTSDFRLTSNTPPGNVLSPPYNVDMFGNERKSWTRGAIEFNAGGNDSLVVNAGPDQQISLPTTSVTLAGSYINPLGGVVSVNWSTVSGPGNVSFSSQLATTTATFSSVGTYTLRLTASVLQVFVSDDVVVTVLAAPDTTAPSSSLTAPASGIVVSNSVLLTATASDNLSVAGVKFFVSGTEVSDDTEFPYTYTWDSTAMPNGSYTICALARDAAGNAAWSGTNVVTVANQAGALPSAVAYWNFDEGAGTIATDVVSANTLTLRNGSVFTGVGKFGAGLMLDGVNDFADAPNSQELEINGSAISVAAWVKLENLSTWQQIVAKVNQVGAFTAPYFSWHLFGGPVSSTQWRPQFQLLTSSGNSVSADSSISVNYGEWVHVLGVYDGSAVQVYVNGVQRGSAPQSGSIITFSQAFHVGAHGLPGEFAKGVIDEVRVYARALTPQQAQLLYLYSAQSTSDLPPPPTRVRIVGN